MVLKVPPLPAYSSQLEEQAKQIFNVFQNPFIHDFPPYSFIIFPRPTVKDSQSLIEVEIDHSHWRSVPGCHLGTQTV